MSKSVEVKAETVYKKKLLKKIIWIIFLLLIIFISVIYLFLYIVYQGGRFTVNLDKNMSNRKSVYLSETGKLSDKSRSLSADTIDYMDNISIKWLPNNLDTEENGSHNGDNYIAYTFYVANQGNESIDYWYSIIIDDVIKNVDEAVRVMIFLNDEKTVYAKKNSYTGMEEKDTKSFYADDEAVLENRKGFAPGDIDKFTVVIWLEGDDPDCVDSILGGEIKMHMEIREEHKEESKNNEKE